MFALISRCLIGDGGGHTAPRHMLARTGALALMVLLANTAFAAASQKLLVAYVGHDSAPAVLARKQQHVRGMWSAMQLNYPRWSLQCLLVSPIGQLPSELAYDDRGEVCMCAALAVCTCACVRAVRAISRVSVQPPMCKAGSLSPSLTRWLRMSRRSLSP